MTFPYFLCVGPPRPPPFSSSLAVPPSSHSGQSSVFTSHLFCPLPQSPQLKVSFSKVAMDYRCAKKEKEIPSGGSRELGRGEQQEGKTTRRKQNGVMA